MKRIAIDNQQGAWFNLDTATLYKETTHWNGNNHISNATGSQWEHEWLYRTSGGKWVLNHYSQYQGSSETYDLITAKEAAIWLVKNEYEDIPTILDPHLDDTEV